MTDLNIQTEATKEKGGIAQAMSGFNQEMKEKEVAQKAQSLGVSYVNLN